MVWVTPKTWNVGDPGTAADLNTYIRDNTNFLNNRTLAQVTSTSSTAGTTTNVDWITAAAVTVDGTRRLRVSAFGWLSGVAVGNLGQLRIMEGATVLQIGQAYLAAAGGPGQVSCPVFWEGVPSSGSHTYKLNVTASSGTITGIAAATSPATLIVEDIGI
jgi:hypothetical protein